MNSVNLVGRLTRDPEMRTTGTGKSVCDFSIAVNKRMKPADGSPDADFFRCIAWERSADYVSTYLGKGRLVSVSGRLQCRKYTASDGGNREVVEIVVENVQGLDRAKDDDDPKATPRGRVTSSTATTTTSGGADEYDPFADE